MQSLCGPGIAERDFRLSSMQLLSLPLSISRFVRVQRACLTVFLKLHEKSLLKDVFDQDVQRLG